MCAEVVSERSQGGTSVKLEKKLKLLMSKLMGEMKYPLPANRVVLWLQIYEWKLARSLRKRS